MFPLETLISNLRYLSSRVAVVSGAQRSGTTLAAHILAQELECRYVDEEDYGTKNILGWKNLIKREFGVVIHSPAMARWLHEISQDDVAVVWILRPAREVEESISRIKWQGVADELAKYKDTGFLDEKRLFSQIKNSYWMQTQKPLIKHAFEIQYRDLSSHPLFLKKEFRIEFTSRQWI